jgi:hypothetical protein
LGSFSFAVDGLPLGFAEKGSSCEGNTQLFREQKNTFFLGEIEKAQREINSRCGTKML